jgi:heptaprenylglyceryl phosphate synthase
VQVCWMGLTLAAGLLEQPVAYIEYSCIYMEQFVLLEKVYEG